MAVLLEHLPVGREKIVRPRPEEDCSRADTAGACVPYDRDYGSSRGQRHLRLGGGCRSYDTNTDVWALSGDSRQFLTLEDLCEHHSFSGLDAEIVGARYQWSPFPSIVQKDAPSAITGSWLPSTRVFEYQGYTARGGRQAQRATMQNEVQLHAHIGGIFRARMYSALQAAVVSKALVLTQKQLADHFQNLFEYRLDKWLRTERKITVWIEHNASENRHIIQFASLEEWHDCIAAMYWMQGVTTALGLNDTITVQVPHLIGPGWLAIPRASETDCCHATEITKKLRVTSQTALNFLQAQLQRCHRPVDPGLQVVEDLLKMGVNRINSRSQFETSFEGISLSPRTTGSDPFHINIYWPF